MATNVSHEYSLAQSKYSQAKTNLEKLAALEEIRSYAPKHKAAEHLRAEISGKIARLKQEIEKEKLFSAKKGSAPTMSVKKDGAAQIALLGLPNSGKSTLLNKLTNATVEIAPYEFTTVVPELGTMDYSGAKIQLVEYPAVIEGSSEGKAQGTQILGAARTADALIICAKSVEDAKIVIAELRKSGIIVNEGKPKIEIKPTQFKGITIAGKEFLKMPEEQLISFLNNSGVRNADVFLAEEATIEKFTQVLDTSLVYLKAAFVNPFLDQPTEQIKEKIFAILCKILVYTKKPGQEPDMSQPLVLDAGSIIDDLAHLVHKDIASNLKFAKVWGSTKFPGQRVAKDYKLSHKDVVELIL